MAAPRKYPDELRDRAVRLVREARAEPGGSKGACRRVGEQLGINPETLRGWVTHAEIDAGQRPGVTSDQAARLAELERENRELRRANVILKSASAFFAAELDPTPVVFDYIDLHKNEFGVEPICKVLKDADVPIAPSTYYAAKTRPRSRRSVLDKETTAAIGKLHEDNFGVYGVRKVWAALAREGGVGGRPIARCTVARLMKTAGLRGISRVKTPRTTTRQVGPDSRPDLVNRAFVASSQDRLWVADITYVKTHSGWVYASFVLDVFSRRVVGWQLSTNLYTDLALDTLNMGIWTRRHTGVDLSALIHHSDRGVQYVAIRYTERLAEVAAVASVGSVGDFRCHQGDEILVPHHQLAVLQRRTHGPGCSGLT